VVRGRLGWAAHGEQEGAGVKGGGGGGVRCSVCARQRKMRGMRRAGTKGAHSN
jgi:hypothetical protein